MWRLPFFRQKHDSLGERVQEAHVDKELRELFIGRRTVFTLLGFILGGVLFGNSLWLLVIDFLGPYWTMGIGIILFILSGILTQQFRK